MKWVILCPILFHTEEFYKNFDFLLSISQKIGIYKYINYANSPTEYCGMMITDS